MRSWSHAHRLEIMARYRWAPMAPVGCVCPEIHLYLRFVRCKQPAHLQRGIGKLIQNLSDLAWANGGILEESDAFG